MIVIIWVKRKRRFEVFWGIDCTEFGDWIDYKEEMNKKEKDLKSDCCFSILVDYFIKAVPMQKEQVTGRIMRYLYRTPRWGSLEMYGEIRS